MKTQLSDLTLILHFYVFDAKPMCLYSFTPGLSISKVKRLKVMFLGLRSYYGGWQIGMSLSSFLSWFKKAQFETWKSQENLVFISEPETCKQAYW